MSQSDLEFHRRIARECFNETWNYLDKRERSDEDKRQMLNLAHASRFHWGIVGNSENLAVGDWQVSRVYAALNQPSLAIHFAKSALEICQKNALSEILVTAYEGMARAYATAKETESARDYIEKARQELGVLNADDEDRKVYLDQIRETEELIGQ